MQNGEKELESKKNQERKLFGRARDIIAEDELGELGQSFNIMADDLLKSYTALKENGERYRDFS